MLLGVIEDSLERVIAVGNGWGVGTSDEAIGRIVGFMSLLLQWNARLNLPVPPNSVSSTMSIYPIVMPWRDFVREVPMLWTLGLAAAYLVFRSQSFDRTAGFPFWSPGRSESRFYAPPLGSGVVVL